MTTLYGIKNCDTVKKARRWLDDAGVSYRFHDFRSDGLEADTLRQWLSEEPWESVINRRSTSWKGLSESARAAMNADTAYDAALSNPTLIKRPVLEHDGAVSFGFKDADYAARFGK